MKIIYGISFILLLFFMTLLPLQKKKTNGIMRILLEIIFVMLFQVAIAILLYLINVKMSFAILSIVFIGCSVGCAVFCYQKKEIQQYEWKLGQMIYGILILLLLIGIGLKQYTIDFEVKYSTTDASTHYSAAVNFKEKKKLMLKDTDNLSRYYEFGYLMVGSYVNTGILMDVLEDVVKEENLYKVYMGFDLMMLWITAMIMNGCIEKYAKGKMKKLVAGGVAIAYLLAYPLNSVIMGSAYLTFGLLVALCIIYLFQEKEQMTEKVWYICLGIFNLGLLHNYMLFAFILLVAEWLYLMKVEEKRKWKMIIFATILPILTLFIYTEQVGEKVGKIIEEGPMYKNYYSNLILFLPIIGYGLEREWKKKSWFTFENVVFVLNILGIILAICLKEMHIISAYYCSKFYYLLWVSMVIVFAKSFFVLIEEKKLFGIGTGILFGILMVSSFSFGKLGYTDEELMQDKPKEKLLSFSEIYRFNYEEINQPIKILTKEEMELIQKVKPQKKEEMQVLGSLSQINWCYALWNEALEKENNGMIGPDVYRTDKVLNAKKILCFKRATVTRFYKEDLLENGYRYQDENQYGGILEKNEIE